MDPVNYYAVAVCGITSLVMGSLWYGPIFGKLWIRLSGITEKQIQEAQKKGMAINYIIAFLGSLLMAYVLAHFVNYTESDSVGKGMQAGFWLWLGFIATTTLGGVLWEGKSWKLYALNNAYYLLQLFIFGSILAIF